MWPIQFGAFTASQIFAYRVAWSNFQVKKVQEAASWLSFELYEIEGNQLSGSSTIDFYNSEVVARKHLLKLMVLTVRPNAIKF